LNIPNKGGKVSRKKVLIADDNIHLHKQWEIDLCEVVEVILTASVKGVKDGFKKHSDISVVVIDAQMPFFTGDLVREIRIKFTGHMIAISSFAPLRKALVKAGCDHECEKHHVHIKVREVLGLYIDLQKEQV
jgi:hypothetical protein